MKTAEEVISIIQEMSPEERLKVTNYLNAQEEGIFLGKEYSSEDIARIERDLQEAEQRINRSVSFDTTEETFAHLDLLRSE